MSMPSAAPVGRFARVEGNDNSDVDPRGKDNANTTISLLIGRGGAVVGAAATTTMTVSTVPPPTTNCGATMVDDESDCGGSRDCGKARTTDANNDPWGGNRHMMGAVDTLDCGDGRGVTGATTTMTTMCEQTSTLAPAALARTTAIACCPLSKRRRIVVPNRKSRHESLDSSAEGGDCLRHRNNNGGTGRG